MDANDPRGPIRTITEAYIGAPFSWRTRLSCGHVANLNPTFTRRVGDECRCVRCGPDGAAVLRRDAAEASR
jgi:hypothetical protein